MSNPTSTMNPSDSFTVFVGAYTGNGVSTGVHIYRLDKAAGKLTPLATCEVENASFLSLDPSRRFLYAVNEQGMTAGQPGGGLSAFGFDKQSGTLSLLNRQLTHGSAPCYVSVDQTNRYALVANYSQGNVVMFPIQSDGSLAPASDMHQHQGSSTNVQRQKAAHAHCFVIDPGNRFAHAADLGAEKVYTYRLDLVDGKLLPHAELTTRAGSGPRHLTYHPNGKWAYLLHELDSTLAMLSYDAEVGRFEELQHLSMLPDDFTGESYAAEVRVSPDGRFVYASNRGHDSIAIFAIDPTTGRMTVVDRASSGGKIPRNFCIAPSGAYMVAANQESNNLVVFRVDAASGKLTPIDEVSGVHKPVCVQIYDL